MPHNDNKVYGYELYSNVFPGVYSDFNCNYYLIITSIPIKLGIIITKLYNLFYRGWIPDVLKVYAYSTLASYCIYYAVDCIFECDICVGSFTCSFADCLTRVFVYMYIQIFFEIFAWQILSLSLSDMGYLCLIVAFYAFLPWTNAISAEWGRGQWFLIKLQSTAPIWLNICAFR